MYISSFDYSLFTNNFHVSSWMISVWISYFGLRRQPSPLLSLQPVTLLLSHTKCSIFPVKFPNELVTYDGFPNAPRYSVLWATSFFWERSCEGAWPWLTKVFQNLNQPLWDIDTGSQRTWISEVPFVSLNLWKYLWSQESLRDSSLHKKSKQTHTYPSPSQKKKHY